VVGKAIGLADQLRQRAGPACVGFGAEIEEQIELPAARGHSRIEIAIVLLGEFQKMVAAGKYPTPGNSN
jgi:hypothetical protein